MSSSYLMNLLASAVAVIIGIVITDEAHTPPQLGTRR